MAGQRKNFGTGPAVVDETFDLVDSVCAASEPDASTVGTATSTAWRSTTSTKPPEENSEPPLIGVCVDVAPDAISIRNSRSGRALLLTHDQQKMRSHMSPTITVCDDLELIPIVTNFEVDAIERLDDLLLSAAAPDPRNDNGDEAMSCPENGHGKRRR